MYQMRASSEKKLTVLLLCYFVGWLGIHRFYTGKSLSGLLMLFTLGGLGVWILIDMSLIIMGRFTDRYGRSILDWV